MWYDQGETFACLLLRRKNHTEIWICSDLIHAGVVFYSISLSTGHIRYKSVYGKTCKAFIFNGKGDWEVINNNCLKTILSGKINIAWLLNSVFYRKVTCKFSLLGGWPIVRCEKWVWWNVRILIYCQYSDVWFWSVFCCCCYCCYKEHICFVEMLRELALASLNLLMCRCDILIHIF